MSSNYCLSLQCEERSLSLQSKERSLSLQCKERSLSLQCEERSLSLQCEERSLSLQCKERSLSLQCKERSAAVPLTHGDILQVASTRMLLHIHPGSETCDSCEPGQVLAALRAQQTVFNGRWCRIA